MLAGMAGPDLSLLPSDMVASAYVFIGDHSSSNSERWSMKVGEVEHSAEYDPDKDPYEDNYGIVQRDKRDFENGKSYDVSVTHLGSTYETGNEDYDYRAWVDRYATPTWTSGNPVPTGHEFFVTDPQQLFQRRYFSDNGVTDPTLGKYAQLHFPGIDLDIDSDNTGVVESSLNEDALEANSTKGAYISVFSGDIDGDGIQDNYDFDGIAGAFFSEVKLSLSSNLAHAGATGSNIMLSFDFEDAGYGTTPTNKLFRLWTKDAWEVRTASDLISAGSPIYASSIGLEPGGTVSLYLESVNPTRRTVHFDPISVTAAVTANWVGTLTDKVHARGIEQLWLDLDIDSDNSNQIDRTNAEDNIEESSPGKIIVSALDDRDGDGIRDWADGFNGDGILGTPDDEAPHLTPIVVEIPNKYFSKLEPRDYEFNFVSFDYNQGPLTWGLTAERDSEGSLVVPTSNTGTIRLWKNDTVRSVDDFIIEDRPISLQDLGIGTDGTFTIYVEGIHPSKVPGDVEIIVKFEHLHGLPKRPLGSDRVVLTVIRADLDVDSNNNNTVESDNDLEDKIETNVDLPGKVLIVNLTDKDLDGEQDFFDNYQFVPGGSTNDIVSPSNAGFAEVKLRIPPEMPGFEGQWKVELNYDSAEVWNSDNNSYGRSTEIGTGKIRLWTKPSDQPRHKAPLNSPGNGDYVTPGTYSAAELGFSSTTREITLYVEAVSPSLSIGDITILLTTSLAVAASGSNQHPEAFVTSTDRVNLTAVDYKIDVDIDSDNDGIIQGSDWEEELEDSIYGIGKLIKQSSRSFVVDSTTNWETLNPFAPVEIKLAAGLDISDPNFKIRVDYPHVSKAGASLLWVVSEDNPDLGGAQRNVSLDVANNGYSVRNGVNYTLEQLRYDPVTGTIQLYIDGTSPSNLDIQSLKELEINNRQNIVLTGTIVYAGVEISSDSVKYIIANEPSIYWKLEKGAVGDQGLVVRTGLASREVYALSDSPNFSLEILNSNRLEELGVPGQIVSMLNHLAGTNEVPGFTAALYKDYIAGPEQYILVFAGTNDVPDIIVDAYQAFGEVTGQYNYAMEIGFRLSEIQRLSNDNLMVTGHSLGGGLASAASIVGNLPAITFNAAGLHPLTLFEPLAGARPDNLLNPFAITAEMIGDELYPGSYDRYVANYRSNAAGLIDAYYVNHDILSFVQDTIDLGDSANAFHDGLPNFIPPMAFDGMGFRRELTGPFTDAQVATEQAILVGAFELVTSEPLSLPVVIGALYFNQSLILNMASSHVMNSALFGLLVDQSLQIDLLGYDPETEIKIQL